MIFCSSSTSNGLAIQVSLFSVKNSLVFSSLTLPLITRTETLEPLSETRENTLETRENETQEIPSSPLFPESFTGGVVDTCLLQ